MKFLSTSLLLLIVSSIVEAQADLVFRNGRIQTMDPKNPVAQAIAVKGDRIVWIGDEKDVEAQIGKGTRVIDVRGAFIYPGMIESHAHILGLGSSRMQIDLTGTKSKEEIRRKVAEKVKQSSPGEWIVGRGWDQNDWAEKKFPTAADLDDVSLENPVVLGRIDGHAVWVNSKALKVAEITRETKDPDGGKIERDETGQPAGILIDNAEDLVTSRMPPLTIPEMEKRVKVALQEAVQKGVTMIHDAGISYEELMVFRNMADKGELPVRIYGIVRMPTEFGYSFLKEGPRTLGPYLEIRSIKITIDGALGSRGAALLQPYSDDPENRGLLTWKEPDFMVALQLAKEKGIQVCTHAIGDRANQTVLDAYEKIGVRGLRWRIEHAQVLAPSDIPRFAKLDVIASMQPTHATSDAPWATDRLGPERVKGAYAWRSLLKHGTHICAGSDAPVEDINPLWGIYAALTRQDHQGQPREGWHPEQRVNREQALRMYTVEGAYASFHEKDLGTLTVGKWADFIVLPEDLMTCDPKDMITMPVLYTVVGGKIRYEAQP